MANGAQPRGSAEKSLGEIVADVTQKSTQLVRQEIELAKAEVAQKLKRLSSGAVMLVAALVTLVYGSLFLFTFLALGLNDWLSLKPWVGFLIVAGLFILLTAALALVGIRSIVKGAPPTPELAIEEAKKTRAALEEARS